MGFNCLKTSEPLRGDSLLFTTRSLEIAGTHLMGSLESEQKRTGGEGVLACVYVRFLKKKC